MINKRFFQNRDLSLPPRRHLDYPDMTMFQMLQQVEEEYPDAPAYEFYKKRTSYRTFIADIEAAASAFLKLGMGEGCPVTICLPNVPQALTAFYGVNRIGAVANMIHPLSAVTEIVYYLNVSGSPWVVTLDMFYEKVRRAADQADHPVRVIVCRMQDALPAHLGAAYLLKEGRKYLKFPRAGSRDLLWQTIVNAEKLKGAAAREKLPRPSYKADRTAVILYSGGTSGKPKGICLTDMNFNALALQAVEAIRERFEPGLTILSCMPLFHGFGLGINIHTAITHGVCCILMPSFNIKTYSNMLIKRRPNFIAGVPTLFDALLHAPALEHADLSMLHGCFCGGDSLTVELKRRVDRFLQERGAHCQIREGYGLTECVTASCLTPKNEYRERSIGLPFPDTFYDIVKPGTDEPCSPGVEGEIVLKGPTLMLSYLNNEEETAQTLRRRSDGDLWLYTGDLGSMDEDGYVYFAQRIKRMIVTNGYNVYPSQLENVLDAHPLVDCSCVIGLPDERRGQIVKAFVVLKKGAEASEATRERLMAHLAQHVAGYALPKEMEFRGGLPKTLVGKVAYRLLEEEELAKGEPPKAAEQAS
ncbi:MAG: acyl--CoA ligase [Clostridia bacterium]|nr:acyl--CoA ligase [Clostridia bacterium]